MTFKGDYTIRFSKQLKQKNIVKIKLLEKLYVSTWTSFYKIVLRLGTLSFTVWFSRWGFHISLIPEQTGCTASKYSSWQISRSCD